MIPMEQLMREAINEARNALGWTHPNPAVGAVIVHQGEIRARGFTQPAGQDHAEIVVLKQFKEKGLTPGPDTCLVVTMEPCSTRGRTGACTEAIIASGIRRVAIGTTDPNPQHRGRGIDILREAGIETLDGVLSEECADLNLIFNWRMEHGGPFFAAKVATTLDGKMATRSGLSKWITNSTSRQHVHHLRRYYPAIAVGAGTVLADDPALTIRIEGAPEDCPVRLVFDRNLVTFKEPLPGIYTDSWKDKTIVVTAGDPDGKADKLEDKHGIRVWKVSGLRGPSGLKEVSARCSDAGLHGILLEGGGQLLSEFLKYRFIHYLYSFRAPKILADTAGLSPFEGMEPPTMQEAVRLEKVHHASFGEDQLMRGFIVYPES